VRDIFITDLSRLSLITVETVKVGWIAIDVSSVSSQPLGLPVRPLPVGARTNPARDFSTRPAAVRRQLNPSTHTVRYEKRIGETKNAFIWDQPARAGKPAGSEITPGRVPLGEGEIEQHR
jgi:hypothetical protein